MGLFGRKRRGPTAFDLVGELELFGRSSLDPMNVQGDYTLEPRAYEMAMADRADFLRTMAEAATKNGGLTAIGAERLTVSVIGANLPEPEYDVLMRAAQRALQEMGAWPLRATGYEHAHAANRQ